MTDRPALDDWLARADTVIGPVCGRCDRPASFEAWHPNRPGITQPLCQAHAEAVAADRLSGNTDAPIVCLIDR